MADHGELPPAQVSYKSGQVLALHRDPEQDADGPEELKLRVIRLHQPWTLSCGMVVEILNDQLTDSPPSSDDPVFLKLFDWRFAHQLRAEEPIGAWTDDAQAEYDELTTGCRLDDFRRLLREEEPFKEETDLGCSRGDSEAFLRGEMLRMYDSEAAAYQRLRDVQETLVPRLITAGFLDARSSDDTGTDSRDQAPFRIKGVSLQYIEGFALSNLDSQAPRSHWQPIIDQAVRVTQVLADKEILNADVRPENFIVEPIHEGSCPYRVFMIDFGESRLRRKGESDFSWGRAKWRQDEEGAVGLVMRCRLRRWADISFYPSLRYLEFAEREDEEVTWSGSSGMPTSIPLERHHSVAPVENGTLNAGI